MWKLLLIRSTLDHRLVRCFEVLRMRRLTAWVVPSLATILLRTILLRLLVSISWLQAFETTPHCLLLVSRHRGHRRHLLI